MGNDLQQPGYVDRGKFATLCQIDHRLFGRIDILRLVDRAKTLNTQNQLLLKCSQNQQFMSIQTSMGMVPLQHLYRSFLSIQRGLSEAAFNQFPFLKIFEIGQKVQGRQGQKGIVVEYYDRTLASVGQQRLNANKGFSEAELWYILEIVSQASQKWMETTYMEMILNKIHLFPENLLINDDGFIKLSNHIIYLTKPTIYREQQDTDDYKDLESMINRNLQKQRDKQGFFCGVVDEQNDDNKNRFNNPALEELSRNTAHHVALLVIGLSNLNFNPFQVTEADVEAMKNRYSTDFSEFILSMIVDPQETPTLRDIGIRLYQLKQRINFALRIETDISKAPEKFLLGQPQLSDILKYIMQVINGNDIKHLKERWNQNIRIKRLPWI